MTEVAAVAAVYGLITGSIAIVRLSIDIYNTVQDKSGIPQRLRKVSEQLQPLEGLLVSARDQYDSQKLDQQIWDDTKDGFSRCKELCEELHDLLSKVYPKEDASESNRLWKNTKTVLSNKSKTAEQLLKEIWDYLDVFAKKGIITNTTLLREIKEVVDELFSQSGNNFYYSGTGDQVAGNKIAGSQYTQGDNGRQIFGSIGTYHEGRP
jgi:hypothetical protein